MILDVGAPGGLPEGTQVDPLTGIPRDMGLLSELNDRLLKRAAGSAAEGQGGEIKALECPIVPVEILEAEAGAEALSEVHESRLQESQHGSQHGSPSGLESRSDLVSDRDGEGSGKSTSTNNADIRDVETALRGVMGAKKAALSAEHVRKIRSILDVLESNNGGEENLKGVGPTQVREKGQTSGGQGREHHSPVPQPGDTVVKQDELASGCSSDQEVAGRSTLSTGPHMSALEINDSISNNTGNTGQPARNHRDHQSINRLIRQSIRNERRSRQNAKESGVSRGQNARTMPEPVVPIRDPALVGPGENLFAPCNPAPCPAPGATAESTEIARYAAYRAAYDAVHYYGASTRGHPPHPAAAAPVPPAFYNNYPVRPEARVSVARREHPSQPPHHMLNQVMARKAYHTVDPRYSHSSTAYGEFEGDADFGLDGAERGHEAYTKLHLASLAAAAGRQSNSTAPGSTASSTTSSAGSPPRMHSHRVSYNLERRSIDEDREQESDGSSTGSYGRRSGNGFLPGPPGLC